MNNPNDHEILRKSIRWWYADNKDSAFAFVKALPPCSEYLDALNGLPFARAKELYWEMDDERRQEALKNRKADWFVDPDCDFDLDDAVSSFGTDWIRRVPTIDRPTELIAKRFATVCEWLVPWLDGRDGKTREVGGHGWEFETAFQWYREGLTMLASFPSMRPTWDDLFSEGLKHLYPFLRKAEHVRTMTDRSGLTDARKAELQAAADAHDLRLRAEDKAERQPPQNSSM